VRPSLEQCVPTGVQLGTGRRIVVMPDHNGVAGALAARLAESGADVLTIAGTPEVEALEQQLDSWLADGSIDGVYWLAALDDEGPLSELDAEARQTALHVRVKLLAAAMRKLAGEDTFLVSGTRLGGRHGYDPAGASSVLGGAVTGFTKALAHERPAAFVKAVDFAPDAEPAFVTTALLEETLRDPGAVEIGYADGLRWSVGLIEQAAAREPHRQLTAGTVFLLTGAAGSIVHEVIVDLATAAGGGTFHLLDVVPAPDAADPDLAAFAADPDGLKRDLAERIRARGDRPTPKLVERELARVERARAALDTIRAIERAGGIAHWHQVDLTDASAVHGAVQAAVTESGAVDVVLHCAGLDISHDLADKPQREYDLVFDVKAHGWLNLLAAFDATRPPGAVVAFSSIAGRFGNRGQTDYSAANDLLCKTASYLRRFERTHAVAIDWTAWAAIGMASRGSIPKVMAAAGIDMLPPEIGATVVRRELTAAGRGGEVVVAGSLGVLLAGRHPTGGIDAEHASARPGGPMVSRIVSVAPDGVLTATAELEPARQAFLNHHRIDGTPVLPGVMGIEAFAEVATALAPGFQVTELTDVELITPFKFYRDEPRSVILRAVVYDVGDGTLQARCELAGRRALHGQEEQETRHFTGSLRLARTSVPPPEKHARPSDPNAEQPGVGHDAVYEVYFHGPAYQVLDRAWRQNGDVVGELAAPLPADHEPADQATALSPRLIELCFQTAGVWELGTAGRLALPMHIDRVLSYGEPESPGRLWAVVHPREHDADADVVDEQGRVVVRLEGYRTIELPGLIDPAALAPLKAAMLG
jgi:KR domain-containing protein/polyketide synthase-like dehydratase family protein/polyketide synthase family protein